MDRRTRYTLEAVEEAFFALLRKKGFSHMTVADICREADISRGTFYLHYEDKSALLSHLIDKALDCDPERSMCQKAPMNDDYLLLYTSGDTFPLVAARVVERGAQEGIADVMARTGLGPDDARIVFMHVAYGNLMVNKQLGWREGSEFEHAQHLMAILSEHGLAGFLGGKGLPSEV